MDKAFFASEDFTSILNKYGVGGAHLTTKEWALLRKSILIHRKLNKGKKQDSSEQIESIS
jgi:hypothetical protein